MLTEFVLLLIVQLEDSISISSVELYEKQPEVQLLSIVSFFNFAILKSIYDRRNTRSRKLIFKKQIYRLNTD